MTIVRKQLHRSIQSPVVSNVSINVCITNKRVCRNGDKEKLPERTRGRILERNLTHLGDVGSVISQKSSMQSNIVSL